MRAALFAAALGHCCFIRAEAEVLSPALPTKPTNLIELPAWQPVNLEGANDAANQTGIVLPGKPSLEGLSRPQVRLVMLLIFAALLGACAWVAYLSIQGSDAFSDVNLSSQMCYQSRGLISWVSLICLEHTIWRSSTLWSMALRFWAWSLFVAVAEFTVAADPSSIDPLQFTEITTVMTVFVSLMLGFFITNSVKRWTSCVEAFLSLFEAIRALQMQLHALGVESKRIDVPVRYGILSAWFIERILRVEQLKEDEREEARDEVFEELSKMTKPLQHATDVEFEALQGMSDPALQIWVWAASYLGRLAQEGDIPPMASPIYGRLLQLVKTAQDALKNIRMVSEIQVPYVYMHTLAAVVHVSNILCATSFGLTLGSCLGSLLVHLDPRLTLYGVTPNPGHSASTDLQVLLIQFMKCFCAPLLYQAFLEIGGKIRCCLSAADLNPSTTLNPKP
ncbi:NSUN2 [Symbiodinium pilosum]|uniref:NSUN2 protein n=1 Tax=Symbiodinium pilosum TaxID=2952 RepID=A0A812QQ91_SYMPI|nr:NSUN2 [Symbiodinium pilosum]